jgi:hypothetical protein
MQPESPSLGSILQTWMGLLQNAKAGEVWKEGLRGTGPNPSSSSLLRSQSMSTVGTSRQGSFSSPGWNDDFTSAKSLDRPLQQVLPSIDIAGCCPWTDHSVSKTHKSIYSSCAVLRCAVLAVLYLPACDREGLLLVEAGQFQVWSYLPLDLLQVRKGSVGSGMGGAAFNVTGSRRSTVSGETQASRRLLQSHQAYLPSRAPDEFSAPATSATDPGSRGPFRSSQHRCSGRCCCCCEICESGAEGRRQVL